MTVPNNLGSYNALKFKFESTSEVMRRGIGGQGGALTISLNGQVVATMIIPLPNSSRIIGSDGKFTGPGETLTERYAILCYAGGGDGASVKFQYSIR